MANARDEDRTGELLIQEVDEDLRNEQYAKLWKRYGSWVIAAAVLVVVIVAGYQGWKAWQERKQTEAGERYGAALALEQAGKTKEADEALAKIAAAGDGTGFAALAGMRRAESLAKAGDTKGAMAAYEQLSTADIPKLMRDLATIKEALLALDTTGDTGAIEARVGALAVSGNPWYYQGTELVALFAHKKGDDKHAVDLFKQLADDAEAPQGIRALSAEMLAALGHDPSADKAVAPAADAAKAPAADAAKAPAADAAKAPAADAAKPQDKK